MPYFSGSKYLYQIIEDIANYLITNYTAWTDGDPTWTTADPSGDNAKRCLKHSDGIYITLEQLNLSKYVVTPYQQFKGLRVQISSAWADNNPSGNIFRTSLQTEGNSYEVTADLAELLFSYYYWVAANGFVLLATPAAHADDQQSAFILAVERNTSKIYSDGQTNFYVYSHCALLNDYSEGHDYTWCGVLRPWLFQSNSASKGFESVYLPRRNESTENVYFSFPYIHNHQSNSLHIFKPELFSDWGDGRGLADGDLIVIGAKKYVCRRVSSPDTVTDLFYAIRYL